MESVGESSRGPVAVLDANSKAGLLVSVQYLRPSGRVPQSGKGGRATDSTVILTSQDVRYSRAEDAVIVAVDCSGQLVL